MEELTNAHGPSGFEGPVREIFVREMRAAGAEISTDGLGSVIAKVKGTADQPRIMVDAHLDEVGMMVRYITPDGYIKFQTLGGWADQTLIDQRWVIMTRKGPIHAVSGMLDGHLADPGKEAFESTKVFMDVGARSKADAEALGIRTGDPIAPWSPFTILANNRYAAKAWDDRVGLVIQVEVLRRMKERGIRPPNTLYLTGTVQEELGLRGAYTTSYIVKPHLGIALEVGIAIDYPGPTLEQAQQRLGGGPGIHLFDSSMLPNLKLRDFFFQVAADKRIPLQTDLVARYGQDAAAMQMHAGGTPSINYVVPTRYTHAHTGIIDRADFDQAVDLLVEILTRLDAKTVNEISRF
jgi:endoglucanase